MEPEHPALNWAKISGLLCFTFGLIAIMWLIRYLTYFIKATQLNTWKVLLQELFFLHSLTLEDWFLVCFVSTSMHSVLPGIVDMEREINSEEMLSKNKLLRKELLMHFKISIDLVRIYLFFYSSISLCKIIN